MLRDLSITELVIREKKYKEKLRVTISDVGRNRMLDRRKDKYKQNIQWIAIYPMDSVIHPSKNRGQVLTVH